MPAGWRPRGVPEKEFVEITQENQIRFRPPMFANAKFYLVLQSVLGILLMMGVISNLYGWSVTAKWAGAFLLWWKIINWSGILEAKKWLWSSELLRIPVTTFAALTFSGIYEPSALMFAIIAVSLFSVLWTIWFFRPDSPTLATA